MWISKRKIKDIEKRIADLEKSQLESMKMVKDYITDSETMSEQLNKEVKLLPQKIMMGLRQYGINK